MQTLWSRAAQTRCSCRCPSCLHTGKLAIARRATTATARRLLQPIASSTFVYSAVFAAATLADAKVKVDRRNQWDRAIANAKQELSLEATGSEEHKDSVRAEHVLEDTVELEDGSCLGDRRDPAALDWKPGLDPVQGRGNIQDTIAFASTGSSEAAKNNAALWDNELRFSDAQREWPRNTGPELNRYHLPPQSLWADSVVRKKAARKEWTPKKTRTLDLSMAKLTLEFILHGHTVGVPITDVDSIPSALRPYAAKHTGQLISAIEEINIQLEAIKLEDPWTEGQFESSHIVYPFYRQDDELKFHDICEKMNKSIIGLFQENAAGRLNFKSLLFKMSHNLLVSTAPPNVDTYNIMIAEFAKRKEAAALVDKVFKSLRETHMRPNEMTCATLLQHYTDRNDVTSFNKFVRLMRSLGDSLMMAQPFVNITDASGGRLRRLPNGKVSQAVYPTPMVYDALIDGVLKFAGFQSALKICSDLSDDGWGLSTDGLLNFLRECTVSKDWIAGFAVWGQLKKIHYKAVRSRGKRQREERRRNRMKIDTYLKMLRFCQACEREAEFSEVFNEAVDMGYSARYLESQTSVYASKMELTTEEQERAATSVQSDPFDPSSDLWDSSPESDLRPSDRVDAVANVSTLGIEDRDNSLDRTDTSSRLPDPIPRTGPDVRRVTWQPVVAAEGAISSEDVSTMNAKRAPQAATISSRRGQYQQAKPYECSPDPFSSSPEPDVVLSHVRSTNAAQATRTPEDENPPSKDTVTRKGQRALQMANVQARKPQYRPPRSFDLFPELFDSSTLSS